VGRKLLRDVGSCKERPLHIHGGQTGSAWRGGVYRMVRHGISARYAEVTAHKLTQSILDSLRGHDRWYRGWGSVRRGPSCLCMLSGSLSASLEGPNELSVACATF
jgi:hypothetical protein